MRFLQAVLELGRVMFIQDREPYHRPEVLAEYRDRYGHVVQQYVYANSGHESTLHLEGTTIQGDRSIVSTHRTDIARGLFDVHIENWATDMNIYGQEMTRSEDYDDGAYLRDRDVVSVDWDTQREIQEVYGLMSDV